ncbi:MAG: aminotransferase class V-fold PLP-dependent enzyme [Pirellulaceae bacterium]
MRSIYLDYSTTTPVAASVRESMLPFLGEFYGHPSSDHWYGRAAQEAIEDARSNVASLLDCHPSEIVFTSGGTESVNLGLLGGASDHAQYSRTDSALHHHQPGAYLRSPMRIAARTRGMARQRARLRPQRARTHRRVGRGHSRQYAFG